MVNFILKDSIYKLDITHYVRSGPNRAMIKIHTRRRLEPGDVIIYYENAMIVDWMFDNGREGHASMISLETARDIWKAIYQKNK